MLFLIALTLLVGLAALARAAAARWIGAAPRRLAVPVAGSLRAAAAQASRPRRIAVLIGSLVAATLGYGLAVAGEAAWYGVTEGPERLVVMQVIAGSAADGRLAAGDILTAVDGRGLEPLASAAAFQEAILAGGEVVEIRIERDDVERTVQLRPYRDEEAGTRRVGVILGSSRRRIDASPAILARRALTAPHIPLELLTAMTATEGELMGPAARIEVAMDPALQREGLLLAAGLLWLLLALIDVAALVVAGLPARAAPSRRR